MTRQKVNFEIDRSIPRDARGYRQAARLLRIMNVITQSGEPDEPFWYLGGPMTGIPQFNFPRFQEVAGILRAQGYNIVSPAELDDPETEAAALASPDGAPGSGSANGEAWEDFLGRDCVIVSMPTCQGAIFLDGWHRSSGADLESYIVDRLKKTCYEYEDGPKLTQIVRDARICELRDADYVQQKIEEYSQFRPPLEQMAMNGATA
jgi:hypothetical protein